MKKGAKKEKKIRNEKTTSHIFMVLAILCIIVFCFAISPVNLQNDTFYTIKIGQDIMKQGIDMAHDRYTWHNLPYTYPHWAYDVMIGAIFNAFGYMGIHISTILFACILGITLFLTQTKLTKNKLTSFVITIGIIYLLRNFIAARAQLITFILFTLTIYFIELFLETNKRRYAIGLIIIPIIIANIHLAVWPFYFVLFLPYIGEYILACIRQGDYGLKIKIADLKSKIKEVEKKEKIAETKKEKIDSLQKQIQELEERIEKRKENRRKRDQNPYKVCIRKRDGVKTLIVIMLICILTGLLTPLGDTPYTYLFKTMIGNTTHSISEHLPLTLVQSKDFMCYMMIFLAIFIFTDLKASLKDFFMVGGLLLLAFISRRQMSMFILIGSFSLNYFICSLFQKYDPEGSKRFIKAITSKIGIVVTILVIGIMSFGMLFPKRNAKFVPEEYYPVKAVEYIKANLDIEHMKLFNEYNNGSYILLHDIPVFIDSRADMYAPEFHGDKDRDIFMDFIDTSSIGKFYDKDLKSMELHMY